MWPAIIAGVAAITSSIIGSRSANKANKRIADNQNALNYKLFREQNAFNEQMADKQNAYNTPLAQRRRFEEAGLNPALMLGQFNAGQAEAVTSATPAPAVGAQMQNELSGVADGVSAISQAMVADAQRKKIKEETKALAIQNKYGELREVYGLGQTQGNIQLSQAQSDYFNSMSDKQKAELLMKEQMHPLEMQALQADVAMKLQQVDILDLEKRLKEEDLKLAPLREKQLLGIIAVQEATVRQLNSVSALNYKQMELVVEQAGKVAAERAGIVYDTEFKKKSELLVLGKLASEYKLNRKRENVLEHQKWQGWVSVGSQFLNATANVANAACNVFTTIATRGFGNIGKGSPQPAQGVTMNGQPIDGSAFSGWYGNSFGTP